MNKIRNLNSVQVFNEVSRLRSVTLAANSLLISQSSVSYHIKKLEDELNTVLFDRSRSGLTLSKSGEVLASHVTSGLRSIQAGLDQASGQTEIVKIAILPLFASRWLSPRLGNFWDTHPSTQLSFRSQNNTFVDMERPSEFVDLWIIWGHGSWTGFKSIRLWPEKMVVVCSPDYLRENPIYNEADLQYRALLHVDDESRWREWFELNQLVPPKSHENLIPQEPHFQLSSAVNGLGVALIPQSMVLSELETGALVNPFNRVYETSFSYYLRIPEGVPLSKSATVFKNWLLAQCAL